MQKGDKILDPCCGMGYTAQIAIDNGMYFYGNELNAKRLQKTINRFNGNS
jgi:predicted methyltransferase